MLSWHKNLKLICNCNTNHKTSTVQYFSKQILRRGMWETVFLHIKHHAVIKSFKYRFTSEGGRRLNLLQRVQIVYVKTKTRKFHFNYNIWLILLLLQIMSFWELPNTSLFHVFKIVLLNVTEDNILKSNTELMRTFRIPDEINQMGLFHDFQLILMLQSCLYLFAYTKQYWNCKFLNVYFITKCTPVSPNILVWQ